MKKWFKKFAKHVESPKFRFAMGVIIIATGLFELFDLMTEELLGMDIRAHHVIIIFGVNQALVAFVHIFAGVETVDKATIKKEIMAEINDKSD